MSGENWGFTCGHMFSTFSSHARHAPPSRIVYKVKGAAAAAARDIPPTPAEAARLDGLTLEQLLAEFRAAAEVFSRGGSAFRGVSWHKATQKWRSRVQATGNIECTYHDTEEEAARAYDEKARRIYGRCAKCKAV